MNSSSLLTPTLTPTLIPLSQFGLIRVSGEDACSFLHTLFTNDVKNLPNNTAQYNSLCTPKGRMLANFLAWHAGTDYLLQVDADLQASLQKRMGMFVLRSKLKITDVSQEFVLVGMAGQKTETALCSMIGNVPQHPLGVQVIDQGFVIRLGQSHEERFQLILHAESAPTLLNALSASAEKADQTVWQKLEIMAGIPWINAATQEEFVPQMVNFDLIGGVSFKKGCYPGQEIVARMQYLGKLKRRMYLATVADETALPGAPLFSPDLPGQVCGTILNAAPMPEGGKIVLAVIQISSAETGDIRLGTDKGTPLVLQVLPYAFT